MPIGLSDHSKGLFAAPLAVAAGAKMIEKHLSLDPTRPGFDHHISLDPSEFAEMINHIRCAETMLGSGKKEMCLKEKDNSPKFHRFLVAKRDIQKNECLAGP